MSRTRIFSAVAVFIFAFLASGFAHDGGDLDNYKWRVDGDWWFSHPSGYFGLKATNNYFNATRISDSAVIPHLPEGLTGTLPTSTTFC